MSLKLNYLLFFSFLLIPSLSSLAQTDTTPYSSQGLGKLSSPGFVHNIGMGGIGIATGNGLRINSINPALLYRNNLYSSFDIAISTEYKDLIKEDETAHSLTGGLAYGAFAFPAIQNRWTLSVGLMPYSTVSYTIRESRTVTGNNLPAQLSLEGEGGISQVYLSNGIRIYKNLAAGIRIGYLFGSIDRDLSILPLTPDAFSYRTSLKESLFYSGLLPEAGIYNAFKIGKTTYLSAGITYQPETKLNVMRNVQFESSSVSNPDIPISQDTITNEPGSVVLPQKLGFGLGLEKSLKYIVGVDITLQQWENFGSYQPDSIQLARSNNDGLRNSMKVSVGGEYIPDVSSINSYLKRATYRLGFTYQHTPFFVNNEQIKDIGVSFGFGLPLSSLSSLNLAFETGRRGATSNSLVQENYFKILLGVSFNDRWFIRRRFE